MLDLGIWISIRGLEFWHEAEGDTCWVRMVVVTEAKSPAGASLRTNAMRASSWPTMTYGIVNSEAVVLLGVDVPTR